MNNLLDNSSSDLQQLYEEQVKELLSKRSDEYCLDWKDLQNR